MLRNFLFFLLFNSSLLFSMEVLAGSDLSEDEKLLLDVPLEDILSRQNLTITSVSKRAERLSEAASAIYVITGEDIRRSGANSIPEALRLAPGLQVASIDSNKWAISSRGFNAQLSNKMLVLIDGRDVYTPLFSGVNWDVQDYIMEDIKRIEVIRGSGATLWGANAVNGVINIITKDAKATPATLITSTYGNEEPGILGVRKGGTFSKNGYYRLYSKYSRKDASQTLDSKDKRDGWWQGRVGFRVDWEKPEDKHSLQGDIYTGREERISFFPSLLTPPTTRIESKEERIGGNILGRWKHQFSDISETTTQVYFDKVIRNNFVLEQDRTTIDFDFQHVWDFNERNNMVWGFGYRYISDDFGNTSVISFTPEKRNTSILSGFLQNKFILKPKKFFLTLGSKFEHNSYTGFEYQPTVRLTWIPDEKQTIWGAISRSVRTPSRAEDDFSLLFSVLPLPDGKLGFIRQEGDRDFHAEELIAYELGYRVQPEEEISIDIATFYNNYNGLRTAELGAFTLDGEIPIQPIFPDNLGKAETYGIEISLNWEATSNWQLLVNYTFLEINTKLEMGSTDVELIKDEGKSPEHQFSIRSQLDLPHNIELDTTLFYVDSLPAIMVDSYVRLDIRLGWTPIQGMDLSLVGQNLLDNTHQEFSAPLHSTASEIERAYYAKITARF